VLGEVAMAAALAAIKIARNLTDSGVAFRALLNLAASLEECFDLRVDVLGFHLVTPSLFRFDVLSVEKPYTVRKGFILLE